MKAVQIVIRRGRMNMPRLDADLWGQFQAKVIAQMALQLRGNFFKIHYSSGGVDENATILGEVDEKDLTRLRNELDQLAYQYSQEAIRLIVGDLEVIGS